MNWFRRFMQGRYGVDQLNFACIIVYFLLSLISRFIVRWFPVAALILNGISFALMIWSFYRLFSRNISKRYKENQVFMKFWNKVKGAFSNTKEWAANRKLFKYFKCPSCKVKVRVPKGKGKLEITCPKCGRTFIKKS